MALNKHGNGTAQVLQDAIAVVDQHLRALQSKQHKEIAKAIGRPVEAVQQAIDYIRTLDPRPGLQYNKVTARLIEPDVAFIKHGDEWLVLMNDDDLPQLRLNPAYKKLVTRETNDKNTRDYVKERYKSAIQLIKNIEQRKQTITKVCYCIVARQQDFLEKGIDQLKPMMIKEVAEEIGVHPSTVSRAVSSKYAHTPQGVFELRYFFSESVQGPEGGNTQLADPETPREEVDRRRRSRSPVDRRTNHPHPAIARHPGNSPHRGQVSGRHAHSQHPSAKSKRISFTLWTSVSPVSRFWFMVSAVQQPSQQFQGGPLVNVEYTGRHYEITPAIRKEVETGLNKIRKILGDRFDANVILSVEKHRHKAEITISPRNGPIVCLAQAREMSIAVSQALDHLEKQAVKYNTKWQSKKRSARKSKREKMEWRIAAA